MQFFEKENTGEQGAHPYTIISSIVILAGIVALLLWMMGLMHGKTINEAQINDTVTLQDRFSQLPKNTNELTKEQAGERFAELPAQKSTASSEQSVAARFHGLPVAAQTP